MLNVTLFKKRNDPVAESFRVSQGNRGDALCEWDYLTLDKALKNLNPKFSVVDYADTKALPNGFRDKVNKPVYITAYYGNDYRNAMSYPDGSALEANSISKWIINSVKKTVVTETKTSYTDDALMFEQTVTAAENPILVKVDSKPDENLTNQPIKTEEQQVAETTKSLFNLGIGLGGTLLITALAISGVVVGSLAADNFNNDDDDNLANSSLGGEDEHPLFIESITGGKLDFTKIWEERGPSKKQEKSINSKNSDKGKEEEMEAPVPANIQTSKDQNSDMSPFDKHDDETTN